MDAWGNGSTLRSGLVMPWLGLGVWRAKRADELDAAVKTAIRTGYAAIDTAAVYGNEEGVGRAIASSGIRREELFITTKLWNADQAKGRVAVKEACKASLKRLGMDHVELYLIHWPVKGMLDRTIESWLTMIELKKEGLVRSIGVSNFHIHHLEALRQATGELPEVNQVEMHPLLSQKPLIAWCRQYGIQMEAYSPLLSGHLADVPGIPLIAERVGKTPAQVILRWDLQNGVIVIPKSVHAERIVENAGIFDFELSPADMAEIDAMNRNRRFLPDPDEMTIM